MHLPQTSATAIPKLFQQEWHCSTTKKKKKGQTSIGQSKHCISDLEVPASSRAELLDVTRELNAKDGACLWWDVVLSLTLHQVHSVKAEAVDLD